jgi:hypothetical protein
MTATANAIAVQSQLQVNNGALKYQSPATQFQASQTTATGPAPGVVLAGTGAGGTAVSFSALTMPAVAQVTNLDPTNFVELGVVVSATFYPLLELQAGETYVWRFSRNLGTLYVRANTAPVEVEILGFSA